MKNKPKTIFRVAKNKDNPYVMIDKRPLENPFLSWKAKGLLAYLLSRPDDWEIILGDLINRSTDGESAVRSALKELREIGHVRYSGRVRESGQVGKAIWEVHEVPLPDSENRGQVEPDGDFPNVDNPNVENPPLNNNDSINNDSIKGYDRKKGRKEAEERIAAQRAKKGDPVDWFLGHAGEITAVESMRRRVETALNKNLERQWDATNSEWNGYEKELIAREKENGETIEMFMEWFNEDTFRRDNQRIWLKPSKIEELWPEAFHPVSEGPDPNIVHYDPEEDKNYVPNPNRGKLPKGLRAALAKNKE